MQTIREKFDEQIRSAEKQVAQLRGVRARLESRGAGVLDVKAPSVHVDAYSTGVTITLYDVKHELPELPSMLMGMTEEAVTHKQQYDDMEYFSFFIAGIRVDLDRHLRVMQKCRKARVTQVIDICGEPGADVEVVEWLTE